MKKTRARETKDINEAAFYIMCGAKVEKLRTLVLNKSVADKRGYPVQWTVYVGDIPLWAIQTWQTGNAYGNITKFVDVRNKLKKVIKNVIASSRYESRTYILANNIKTLKANQTRA